MEPKDLVTNKLLVWVSRSSLKQCTREEYPNLSLGNLYSQLIDIVYEVVEELSFRF